MPFILWRDHALSVLALVTFAGHSVAAQEPAAKPGMPLQTWTEVDADNNVRRVYFRNDTPFPITVSDIVIQVCQNTRQQCGPHPTNTLVPPGKTVPGFKVERLDRRLTWSFGYSFRTHSEGVIVNGMLRPGTYAPTGGGPAMVVRAVPVDSLAPAVAAWTEGAACGQIDAANLPAGHRLLIMVFGNESQPTARQVTVRLDANGVAYDYNELRRDPNDTSADALRSQILLDLVHQSAIVRDSRGNRTLTLSNAVGPNLLTAASLGRPGETIARIVRECGGARSPL